ncbi:MAG TPA: type II secretion system secretin GspD, partial [Pseudomonadales bacterium]|nr:type II secretion system secretin GspD [Pseudomonadales bacterium]
KNAGKAAVVEGDEAGEAMVTIAFDNADVKDVIRWASDLTEKNIIVHPGVAGKKITVVAGEPMTRIEAWQVFLSALQVNGLAVMENGDTVKILPEADAKSEKMPLADADNKTGKEDMVVRIVKVKNLAAAQLISLLKPLTPNTAHFAAYPETNTLIIADRAGNIDQIVNIIGKIDQAGTIDIEIIKLEYASAKDVAKILSELVQKTAGKEGTAPSQALNITSDERSNSILMTGDPVMRMQMRKLIQKLDQPLAGDGNTQVVYLNYITAKDMLPILEGVGGSAKGGTPKEAGPQEVEVNIQALEQTNAVVITAPPSMLNTMKGVIAKLDVRRKQVLVEAIIVEVSADISRDLGVFWNSNGGDGVQGRGVFRTSGADFEQGGNKDAFLDSLNLGGVSLGYFNDGSMRALLRALEGNTDANVLSTPTVIALDNEEAKILVGESVPFKTGVERTNSNVVSGGITGNRDTQYNNDFVQIDRQDIGVTLKVTPRINQDGVLTLEIEQKVESINSDAKVGGQSGASDIITNKREISTTALVKDDGVLVLGGLMRDEVQTAENGVPFLKDIPVIGNLFKGKSKGSLKKNLMVFIHPRILYDDEDNARETSHYYESVRKSQEKFNNEDEQDYFHINKPMPELDALPHDHGEAQTSAAPASVPVQVKK